ncbi:thioredoxin-dependent thiol peroxidase [Pyxidicoccus xibeiensis]|uniref:thioredoxin-dependent thiol peroxidase n=1 Tax=Pyxidicoccus xibeiensis TaxID=2906759 RepID=UPI0020A82540|nr:thioredoxin-dependent thiol peroxidase [Pyxidicoccus xibeiensis]MCP3139404.1 thioredoxin-dependent thiol peroxidase [Pyxidicoccus xibeiensis]
MPQAGDAAPGFQLPDQDGNSVTLSQHAGKNVVLYFYPKDDTPGCTKEACDFRDQHSALRAAGAVVLGVSADSAERHKKFAAKYNLSFPLLADPDRQALEAYGVWGEKTLYGRKFQGITRATFLIGPDGRVKQVWPKVKVSGHVDEVLAALGASSAPAPKAAAPAKKAAAPAKKAAAPAKKAAAPAKKAAAPAKKAAVKKVVAAVKGAARKVATRAKAGAKGAARARR